MPPHTYTLFLPCQQKTSTVADPLCHVERKRIWLFLERLPIPFKDSQVPPARVSHLSSAFVRSVDILYSGLVPTHFNIRDADLHLASPNHGNRQPVDKASPNARGNSRCRLLFSTKAPTAPSQTPYGESRRGSTVEARRFSFSLSHGPLHGQDWIVKQALRRPRLATAAEMIRWRNHVM